MTVKPLVVVPFVQVSMMAPKVIMLAVVTLPHLRPILSPMIPVTYNIAQLVGRILSGDTSLAASIWRTHMTAGKQLGENIMVSAPYPGSTCPG